MHNIEEPGLSTYMHSQNKAATSLTWQGLQKSLNGKKRLKMLISKK